MVFGVFLKERIGYIREVVKVKIGRIYPKDEVLKHGYKVEIEAKEGG